MSRLSEILAEIHYLEIGLEPYDFKTARLIQLKKDYYNKLVIYYQFVKSDAYKKYINFLKSLKTQ